MMVTMTCGAGFAPEPQASARMTCQSNGQWSYTGGGYVSCIRSSAQQGEVGCVPSSHPQNGQWQQSQSVKKTPNGLIMVGTIMPMQCNAGYSPSVVGASITCDNVMGSGKWVGKGLEAQCQQGGSSPSPPSQNTPPPPPSTCSAPNRVVNGKWSQAPFGNFVAGMTTIMTCDEHYAPQPDAAANMLCGSNSQWTYSGGTYVSCVRPQPRCASCSTFAEFKQCSVVVTKECCDEPREKCVNGQPQTCNAGCAAVLRPMVAACNKGYLASRSWMSSTKQQLETSLKTCDLAKLSCNTPNDLFVAIAGACCKNGAKCSNGLPKSCTAKCASVLVPMQKACLPVLNSPGMDALQKEVSAAVKRCASGGH
jgi:hypothetical protein